ncbi:ParA family protein [Vibrio agarivorans]|uniref:ParA family protein n=1 Tax=Vibrio agarivorans TaxID=153622 RepID=UPI0025B29972|nr:ParA family protein [Vibrio agarivorans]MDN3661165.1 ParA family protein [Vibrio agarivorans]
MNGLQTLKAYTILAERFRDVISRAQRHEYDQQIDLLSDLNSELYVAPNGKRQKVFCSLTELGEWLYGKKIASTTVKRLVDKYQPTGVIPQSDNKPNIYRIPMSEAMRIATGEELKTPFKRDVEQDLQTWLVGNLKGGSGKTTTTYNLALALATELPVTYRVGVIDLDPQGSLTATMLPNLSEDAFSVGDIVMQNFELDEGETYQDFIRDAFHEINHPNVRVLPAKETDNLFNLRSKELGNDYYKVLEPIIDAVRDDFDIILFDTPPNINDITIAAHFSATSVLIPLHPSDKDRDGTYKYLKTFKILYEELVKSHDHQGYDNIRMLTVGGIKNSATDQELLREIWYAGGTTMLPDLGHSEAVKKAAFKYKSVLEISPYEYSMKVDGKVLYGTKESHAAAMEIINTVAVGVEGAMKKTWGLAI